MSTFVTTPHFIMPPFHCYVYAKSTSVEYDNPSVAPLDVILRECKAHSDSKRGCLITGM